MQPFKYSKTNRSASVTITEAEEAEVSKVLGSFKTKQQAITYLYNRGWSTKQICQAIAYDDGRPLREQHVNQVVAKVRAAK